MHSINSRERNVGSNATIPLGPNLGRAFDIGPKHALLSRVHIHQVNQPAFHQFHTNMIEVHKKFRAKIDSLSIVQMCHVCRESYPGIQVLRGSEGPMCKR
jgi:hypothetical protein